MPVTWAEIGIDLYKMVTTRNTRERDRDGRS